MFFSRTTERERGKLCREWGTWGRLKWNGEEKITFNFHKKNFFFQLFVILACLFRTLLFSWQARAATTMMIRWWMMSSTCDNEVYRRRVNSSSVVILFFSTLRSLVVVILSRWFHDKSLDWPRHFSGESVVTAENLVLVAAHLIENSVSRQNLLRLMSCTFWVSKVQHLSAADAATAVG